MADAFELRNFTTENLYSVLQNEWLPATDVANNRHAKYLAGYLESPEIGAKTIVAELDYVDADYLDDYVSYYSRCFQTYQRRCKRIHFFSHAFDVAQFRVAIHGNIGDAKLLTDSYLGFVVARPLPDAIIGRTVLALYPPDDGRRNYPCVLEYSATLFGLHLSVRSLAFQEQDTVLAACATVALWCCLDKTRELFPGSLSPTPAEITRAANQVIHHARPIPSRGLIADQICSAIRQAGLEHEVVWMNDSTPILSLLYGHLRMGLPVILGVDIEGLGGHAIAVAGYSLLRTRHLQREIASNTKSAPMIGLRINELYAHDDGIGPFSRLRVEPSTAPGRAVHFTGTWERGGNHLPLVPKLIVVPVYHKIRVTYLDIQVWVDRLTAVLSTVVFGQGDGMEWDVHLTMTNQIKREMKESGQLAPDELDSFLFSSQPRFMWCAILRWDGVPLMRLFFDATGMSRSLPLFTVLWHDTEFKVAMRAYFEMDPIRDLLIHYLTRPFFEELRKSALA